MCIRDRLGEKYIASLKQMGESASSKVVVLPADLQDALRGLFSRLKA